jgi:hypothetical protein
MEEAGAFAEIGDAFVSCGLGQAHRKEKLAHAYSPQLGQNCGGEFQVLLD